MILLIFRKKKGPRDGFAAKKKDVTMGTPNIDRDKVPNSFNATMGTFHCVIATPLRLENVDIGQKLPSPDSFLGAAFCLGLTRVGCSVTFTHECHAFE